MILPQGVIRLFASLRKEVDSLKDRKIIIAIDGFSSSGKSTLSKDLASLFEMVHIDTGAMYRAVTYHMMQKKIDLAELEKVKRELGEITIDLRVEDGSNVTYLNGINVEREIRSSAVSDLVSHVAALSCVRKFLVEQQRLLGKNRSVIMDGRDIGTVVFPDANIKLFVTASKEVRTTRRYSELLEKGLTISKNEVRRNLTERDHIDSTREDSPLLKANDAISLDTSDLDRNTMVTEAARIILTNC